MHGDGYIQCGPRWCNRICSWKIGKQALDDLGITTAVSEISKNTKTQADKKEQTIVEIGGKTVTDAVTTQRNANGYSFQGA